MAVKTLTIDGKLITAREDQTLLDAAREAGIAIPTLCHLDGVSDVGACRLCLVEVRRQQPAPAGLRHRASPRAWTSGPTPSGSASTGG